MTNVILNNHLINIGGFLPLSEDYYYVSNLKPDDYGLKIGYQYQSFSSNKKVNHFYLIDIIKINTAGERSSSMDNDPIIISVDESNYLFSIGYGLRIKLTNRVFINSSFSLGREFKLQKEKWLNIDRTPTPYQFKETYSEFFLNTNIGIDLILN